MSNAVNTGFVLDMQRKLYWWSHADPNSVFGDVFNLVCDRRMLAYAWQRLAQNRGSRTPGSDGMGRYHVEKRPGGVEGFLEEIREELRSGTYRPEPVRQRLIPKPGKPGKFRPLGIPTLKDRLVQTALKLVLEPIFEADFYPTSFGFRRRRCTHDAIAVIQRQINPTSGGDSRVTYVIEGDIKGCFDNIDHHLLMERVRRRIKDRKVLRLVRAFLQAGVLIEGTVRHPVAGTPQGGIISPLLSNIFLTAIDERYRRWTPAPREALRNAHARRWRDYASGRPIFYIVRYADDFVVLVSGTREVAEAEKDALAKFLKEELRLELSPEKTLVTDVRDGFEFLGYRIVKTKSWTGRFVCKLLIPLGKLQMLRDKIKARTKRRDLDRSFADLIDELNPLIMGWRTYYRHALRACREFNKLDWWLYHRIKRWLHKKYPKTPTRVLWRRFRGSTLQTRWRLQDRTVRLRKFTEGGTNPYPFRGTKITNGWDNVPEAWNGDRRDDFWHSLNVLASAW